MKNGESRRWGKGPSLNAASLRKKAERVRKILIKLASVFKLRSHVAPSNSKTRNSQFQLNSRPRGADIYTVAVDDDDSSDVHSICRKKFAEAILEWAVRDLNCIYGLRPTLFPTVVFASRNFQVLTTMSLKSPAARKNQTADAPSDNSKDQVKHFQEMFPSYSEEGSLP